MQLRGLPFDTRNSDFDGGFSCLWCVRTKFHMFHQACLRRHRSAFARMLDGKYEHAGSLCTHLQTEQTSERYLLFSGGVAEGHRWCQGATPSSSRPWPAPSSQAAARPWTLCFCKLLASLIYGVVAFSMCMCTWYRCAFWQWGRVHLYMYTETPGISVESLTLSLSVSLSLSLYI